VPNTAADPQVPVAAATSSQISWLALTLTPGLGPTRAKRLVEFFGGVEAVFNASLTELEAAGLPATAAQSLDTGKSVELAHDEIAKATSGGHWMYYPRRPSLPSPSPPNLRSSTCPLRARQRHSTLATRHCRDRHPSSNSVRHWHGRAVGQRARRAWLRDLQWTRARSGYCRSSGCGCSQEKTVAVFGTGADVVYPKENSRLADQILSVGRALISEFPMGTFARPQNFPIPNRIISEISFWGPRC